MLYEFDKDTLKVWYDQPEPEKWKLIIRKDTILNDTIAIQQIDRTEFIKTAQLRPLKAADKRPVKINPNRELRFSYSHPLRQFDQNLIRLYEDTTRTMVRTQLSIDSINFRTLSLQFPWKEGKNYALEILPGALGDIFELSNQDTFRQDYTIESIKNLGIIDLTVNNLNPDTAYVIELISGESNVIDTIRATGQERIQRRFENLAPGKFSVRIITDLNGNGRWDTGNYNQKRQPEPIFRRELEALRANWEVKAEIVVE